MDTNFARYDLLQLARTSEGVFMLAGGVVPEIAERFGFSLGTQPTAHTIGKLLEVVAPHKELKRNIAHIRQILGSDAVGIATSLLLRSGITDELPGGSFWDPSNSTMPEYFDYATWMGATGKWQLERLMRALRVDPASVGTLVLPAGVRAMVDDAHQTVQTWHRKSGRWPTEQMYADRFVLPLLLQAWFNAKVLPVDSEQGRDVYSTLVQTFPDILTGTVLVVGNQPATLQVAGAFRDWARKQKGGASFDSDGDQLFVVADHCTIATEGQSTATRQDPLSGVGALLRCAMYLQRAVESVRL